MDEQNRIKQEVTDHLVWDARLKKANISVDFKKGTIILNGSVSNPMARRAAENNALSLTGVNAVENNLIVETGEQRPDDRDLKETIERNLYWNDFLDYSNFSVMVDKGVVKIQGEADAFWKKNLVTELAEQVRGVELIKNEVAVKNEKTRNDATVTASIREALRRHHTINENNIEPVVVNGFVTLKGSVKNRDQNMQAYEASLYTDGVTGIDNQLAIENEA